MNYAERELVRSKVKIVRSKQKNKNKNEDMIAFTDTEVNPRTKKVADYGAVREDGAVLPLCQNAIRCVDTISSIST